MYIYTIYICYKKMKNRKISNKQLNNSNEIENKI